MPVSQTTRFIMDMIDKLDELQVKLHELQREDKHPALYVATQQATNLINALENIQRRRLSQQGSSIEQTEQELQQEAAARAEGQKGREDRCPPDRLPT